MGGLLPPAGLADPHPGAVSGGGRDPSRGRSSDGGDLRGTGERGVAPRPGADGPRFDGAVPPGGYAWWYVDALSADGRHGLTLIAFIGAVFSPYYLKSGKKAPEDHVALNVALYGPGARWTLTERGSAALRRDRRTLAIGPSSVHWDGTSLAFAIEERGALLRERVSGTVRIRPEALVPKGFALDPAGRHRWHPIAARAHVEARFDRPALRWSGTAYVDSNFGSEPMENRFQDWQWSRAHVGADCAVFYEGRLKAGDPFALSLRFDRHGIPEAVEAPPLARMPHTKWLMPRATRSDPGAPIRLLRTWEDTPFYSRSALETRLWGDRAVGVHESLSLTRFTSGAVQWMIPWRMPRVT